MNSTMHIYPINGACHRVAPEETAFAYRDATFATVIAGMWPDPAQNTDNIAWVRDYYEATAPHSEAGGYVNFMAADDQDRVRANYRGNYDRLVEVKRRYDPDNLFHLNQNITP
ncbi:MAG: BBE domain-containing protein [Pseudonocardia sp.]